MKIAKFGRLGGSREQQVSWAGRRAPLVGSTAASTFYFLPLFILSIPFFAPFHPLTSFFSLYLFPPLFLPISVLFISFFGTFSYLFPPVSTVSIPFLFCPFSFSKSHFLLCLFLSSLSLSLPVFTLCMFFPPFFLPPISFFCMFSSPLIPFVAHFLSHFFFSYYFLSLFFCPFSFLLHHSGDAQHHFSPPF